MEHTYYRYSQSFSKIDILTFIHREQKQYLYKIFISNNSTINLLNFLWITLFHGLKIFHLSNKFLFEIYEMIIIINYQKLMREEFEKNLELLKNRPNRLLVDVKVKGRLYELEVYDDTTLKKIIQRYVRNGYYDENQRVTKVKVNGKQSYDSTQIKQLIKGQFKQISNIKIQLIHESNNESSANQNQSLLQQSDVKVYENKMLQNQKQNNSQYKAQSDKISPKQLDLLIENKIKNKLQIQQRFRDFSKIIDKYTDNLNNKIIASEKTITNLKNFVSFLGHKIELFHKQKKVNVSSMTGSKIMDQNSKKQISLDRNQKKITEQLELIMKSKENDTTSQQLISYIKQIRKIINSKQQREELAKLNKKSESVNDTIKKISQQIINDFKELKNSNMKEIQNLNQKIINLNDQIKVLQKKLQKSKTVKQVNEGIKLRTSFINNLEQEKKIIFLKNEIENYEGHQIDHLETVLEFNKCQIINFQIIVNLLDGSSFSPFSRILMIIGIENESFMVYSTKGIYQEGSSIKIGQAEKGIKQACCLTGAGFLILGNQLKKFQNSNGKVVNSIIKYNKKILSIGNRLNMLYSTKKKIEMVYKNSTEICELEDNNNELQNTLKNKKLEVISIQMYKVMINYKKNCESSYTKSTEATMSSYRKQQ